MGLSCLTIGRAAAVEIEVKRSRFLGTVRRVETEQEARAVVEDLRKEHWDARHTCSAFVLGPPPQPIERSNDDGEPAGTAGAPMLEVLRGHEGAGVHDVVAVVTRWFGGTLLGAGGLVRAYSEAVRGALDQAGTVRRELLREYTVEVGHDTAGRLETALRTAGVAVLDTVYAEAVTVRIGAPPEGEPRLAALIAELTAGATELVPGAERWVDRPEPQ